MNEEISQSRDAFEGRRLVLRDNYIQLTTSIQNRKTQIRELFETSIEACAERFLIGGCQDTATENQRQEMDRIDEDERVLSNGNQADNRQLNVEETERANEIRERFRAEQNQLDGDIDAAQVRVNSAAGVDDDNLVNELDLLVVNKNATRAEIDQRYDELFNDLDERQAIAEAPANEEDIGSLREQIEAERIRAEDLASELDNASSRNH